MTSPLAYCPDCECVLDRLRRLYQDRSQEIVLARMNVPNDALAEFGRSHAEGFCGYPDPGERIAFWDAFTRDHVPVHDDSIPSCYLTEMDQGLYGGLFGGDVRFLCDPRSGWISSMVPPLLKDWSQFESRMLFHTDHPWYRRYVDQLDKFVRGSEGKFGISHFILINGLNFVFELVGATQTYLDLDQRPEMIRRAIELAHQVNLQVHQTFFDQAPLVAGGTCSIYAQWIPGRIVSESVDPFHMTSVDYFERWGRGPVERIFAQFDGGAIHIHGNGRHLLKAVSTLRGLKVIWLGDDKGYPPAFQVLPQLKSRVGDVPVICLATFPEFARALKEHRLIGGVFYDVLDVPDVDTANRCMELVRSYRIENPPT